MTLRHPGIAMRLFSSAAALLIACPAFADSQVDVGRGPIMVHVPASYNANTPTPLAILLHGFKSTGSAIERFFGFATAAETAGIIYATPEGTTNQFGITFWNATDACCNFNESTVDDSAYLRSLVEAIQADYTIDDRRIYFAGLSNGGFMSYRMACDHADLIAGIVSVAGATFDTVAACTPTEPVHVLQIHGTADPFILYTGGVIFFARYPSAAKSVETWAQYNGCDLTPVVPSDTLDLDARIASAETSKVRYADGCSPGGSAELWTVDGGAHVLSPTPDFGTSVAEFMLAHPRPGLAITPTICVWGLACLAAAYLIRRGHQVTTWQPKTAHVSSMRSPS